MDFFRLLSAKEPDLALRFLEAWHGPAQRPPGPLWTSSLPRAVPELEAASHQWPRAFVFNRLVNDPEGSRDGAKRVLYQENQAVHEWATDGRGDDPVVFGCYVPVDGWQAEREPLSRFLVQVVLFEAIVGARHGAQQVDLPLEAVEEALAPLQPIPFGVWRWPAEATRFYAGEDLLAVVNPLDPLANEASNRFQVIVAGRTAGAAGYLASVGSFAPRT